MHLFFPFVRTSLQKKQLSKHYNKNSTQTVLRSLHRNHTLPATLSDPVYPKPHTHLLSIYKLHEQWGKQKDQDTVPQALWSMFCCDHLAITTDLRLQLNNSTCLTLQHFVHSVQTGTHSYSPRPPRLHRRSFDK